MTPRRKLNTGGAFLCISLQASITAISRKSEKEQGRGEECSRSLSTRVKSRDSRHPSARTQGGHNSGHTRSSRGGESPGLSRFLATPGHTPGQGCYHDDDDILVGDTLFAGSIGRTDFPMSDPSAMRKSLRRLLALPGRMRVHSGHGPMTTLARELADNPWLGFLRIERDRGARRGLD